MTVSYNTGTTISQNGATVVLSVTFLTERGTLPSLLIGMFEFEWIRGEHVYVCWIAPTTLYLLTHVISSYDKGNLKYAYGSENAFTTATPGTKEATTCSNRGKSTNYYL